MKRNNVRLKEVKMVDIASVSAGTHFGIDFGNCHGLLQVIDPKTTEVKLRVMGRNGFTHRFKLQSLRLLENLSLAMNRPGTNGHSNLTIMALCRVDEVITGHGFPRSKTPKLIRTFRRQTRDLL